MRIYKHKDITNQRYGKIVAVKFIRIDKSSKTPKTLWLFECDCGNNVTASLSSVQNGYRKSCGCLRNLTGKNHSGYKHGRSKTKEYLFEKHLKHAYGISINEYNNLKENKVINVLYVKK